MGVPSGTLRTSTIRVGIKTPKLPKPSCAQLLAIEDGKAADSSSSTDSDSSSSSSSNKKSKKHKKDKKKAKKVQKAAKKDKKKKKQDKKDVIDPCRPAPMQRWRLGRGVCTMRQKAPLHLLQSRPRRSGASDARADSESLHGLEIIANVLIFFIISTII